MYSSKWKWCGTCSHTTSVCSQAQIQYITYYDNEQNLKAGLCDIVQLSHALLWYKNVGKYQHEQTNNNNNSRRQTPPSRRRVRWGKGRRQSAKKASCTVCLQLKWGKMGGEIIPYGGDIVVKSIDDNVRIIVESIWSKWNFSRACSQNYFSSCPAETRGCCWGTEGSKSVWNICEFVK